MRILSLSCLVFLAWPAMFASVWGQSARIAIVGDPSLNNLVDVTTAELSKNPGLTLLERTDLDKLGQEQALMSVMNSNNFSPVRLLPADGLIVLRTSKQEGKTGKFARLVAVQPGVVLREMALPDGDDPLAQAQALAKEFAPYVPKLAAIRKGKTTALSLLGLRFEVDAPETREMERQINFLLASRLSAEPDTLVLERWRLNDAVFEKSLGGTEPAPFWTGSSLIDGSMKLKDKQVEVSLRVRPPQGAEIAIADKDTVDNLGALIGRLADKIQAHPMPEGGWQPAAEASHYSSLGKWCLDNGLYDEGAGAIESALALGDGSRTTHMLQIRAYALLAYPGELQRVDPIYGLELDSITWDSLPGRLKAGTQAADLTCDYLKANHDFSDPAGTMEDPAELSLPVLNNCLRLIRTAYDKGFQREHENDVADLRHEVKKLILQMQPLLAGKPSEAHDTYLKYLARYAAFWHESPEDTLSFYRQFVHTQIDGVVIGKELFAGYPMLHPPYLDATSDLPGAMAWNVGSPWIVAWDDRSPADLKPIWEGFLKELASSPDPAVQATGLKFEFNSIQTPPARDEAGARIVTFLQQHPENISGPHGNDFITGFASAMDWAVRARTKTSRDQLRDLGQTLLKQRAVLASEWVKWMPEIYYQLPPESARPLLASLDDYRTWYQTQLPQDPELAQALDEARRPLLASAGTPPAATTPVVPPVAPVGAPAAAPTEMPAEITPPGPKGDFLTVSRHWPTQMAMGSFGQSRPMFPDPWSVIVAENKVWFSLFGPVPQILCVDPATLQIVSSFSIPIEDHPPNAAPDCNIAVSPDWLAATSAGHVLLCSRPGNQWRTLDVPPSNYKPRWINQQLYLIYEVEPEFKNYRTSGGGATASISGLMHVSLPDGAIENIISSRRIPPQSALDGKPLGYPLELWDSSAGLTLAVDADSPHFQVFASPVGKNNWASVTTDPLWCDVKIGAGGALVGRGFDEHGFAQLVLMNGTTAQVLLANPGRTQANGAGVPVWDYPAEMAATPPDVMWQASPVMRGDDLCLYRNVLNAPGGGPTASLYYFAKGQKNGVKIPLNFGGGSQNPRSAGRQSIIGSYHAVQATDYGLIITQVMGGFWVIPWHDIDAYRAQSGAAPSSPSGGT
jgi:hypothetical protein